MSSEIIIGKDIHNKASDLLKKHLMEEINEKGTVILGLPGGRNISPILSKLKKAAISWEKVHVFLVDERLVPLNDLNSNFRLINKELSEVIPQGNLHPFIFNKNVPDFGLKRYEKEIKMYGGKYDIVLLSAGEDGHISSLFPDHPALHEESEYYIVVEDAVKPPPMRISISKSFLKRSKIGILLFNGIEKKSAFEQFQNDTLTFEACPAKIVNELPRSYILININQLKVKNTYA